MGNGGSNAIIITTAVLFGFSLVTVSLRCFVRLKIVKCFGPDDALMVAAAAFNMTFAICGIVGASYGMGKAPAFLRHRPDDVRRGLLCWWLGQIFYVFTCTIVRLSIATTLFRLTVERIHLWILYGIMVASTVVGTVFLFFTILQCLPVAYYWNQSSMEGRCLDIDILLGIVYMYSGVAAACDFTLGFLPVFMIWRLQMNRGTKFVVSAILGLACMFVYSTCSPVLELMLIMDRASMAVIIRMPFLHYAGRPDFLRGLISSSNFVILLISFTDATTQISIWSNVEASLGIAAGSLMTIRPLLRVLITSFPMLRNWSGGEGLESRSSPSTPAIGLQNYTQVGEYLPECPE
ncbi:hypothetical protein N7491_011269 [Penicillium cf. griseofulvum]|uniref:Rhodopsin domain-containing protein n=1 Tax=Penicillium cf. griseofulvum TaxID=2972120 RepID=A0A9W9MEZ0_9EURO|nr:hypothetical protein N7472_004727 [Penicillium cf. griseofulvum]KAJ5416367.1 hypothetical protein N7491_011269 [Penicillium cf. griseofulvum]